MLELINQLLDFRKLEMGGEKLNLSRNDFVGFVKYTCSTFKELANNRNINFILDCEYTNLQIGFDRKKMQKILNNMYSNAIKFTPEGGCISTSVKLLGKEGREFVELEISDTGCGIEEKDLDLIFDRFFQSESNDSSATGSGIGLHLVKEYVLLHEGSIRVSSKISEGSTFTIDIPTDLSGDDDTENNSLPSEEQAYTEKKTLLIVEDNPEFRHFLAEQLSRQFNVLQAGDGEQGLEIASQKYPDLIISDLMMPVMNGLEMCERVKTDLHISHIPVILLTARLSDEAKAESYRAGADSYISKPFSFDVLMARIEMLIEQQEKRRELFRKNIEIQPESITITSLDEQFVTQALASVEKNIQNPEYSTADLCDDLGMSKSRLYPKFQSITGLTPNNFIRSIRLKRAAQLLKDSQYNINEISDMAGFNTIKYFNKYFKEEFGITPTEYRKENTNTFPKYD
jgi:DNA-binding response OmpR family regulator